ncbi:MAG TPA: 3-keto-5-aminohexanoate cleavage protein [Burkholderiales bacterium]|nr:3-keto-5-aminohexanoate cleavage protein [Burkholderiales bacterium]
MDARKTWLEVALNGPWGRARQPGIPVSVRDIVDQAAACVRAGAAIVHVHAYDESSGAPRESAAAYAAIIEGIRRHVDAIVYPTVSIPGMAHSPVDETPPQRFAVHEELAQRGLLEWAAVDPGSLNIASYDDLRQDRDGFVYRNPEQHLRYALGLAARYRFHPSYAIYEPGFLRLGASLHWRCACPAPIYRFMFSTDYTFGFPADDYGLTAYLKLMDQVAPGARWMVAGLGVDIRQLVPRAVAEGGHVRVGLEDASLGCAQTNVELVEAAARMINACGGELATAVEVRAELRAAERGEAQL